MTITTKGITNQIPRKLNFKNVNRDSFQDEIENNININLRNNLRAQEIEEKLEQWYNCIETAIDHNIPTTS